jgi:glyceraldehyde 3-phosphate dehydrogenase
MINVAINGFGRIGKVLLRQILCSKNIRVVAINDLNSDINNIAYLIKYDTTYGIINSKVRVQGNNLIIDSNKIKYSNFSKINQVKWNEFDIDFLIDSSGNKQNLILSRKLKNKVKKVIVTNSPGSKYVDKTLIFGVNESEYNKKHFLISTSICDSTALAPVFKIINKLFQIEKGFVTTLHPWLGYQNLLDGHSRSYSLPGKTNDNYALGRSSLNSLIPKNTSAIKATYEVLPELKNKFLANSFRVPTSIVTSADIVLLLKKKPNLEFLIDEIKKMKIKIISLNKEALVSTDFLKNENSCILDLRFFQIVNNFIKFTLWYDNEWGYCSKVIDLIKFIKKSK